eukprot:gnl/MRDRNA2_/MRDRNA2_73240_c0_seq2.p1 gnl/MRDRNA2_/MRDRNA2_73240_c0~~gnl/MRDRNA2_/MRDRNA2_73240_c0_seq2.p1  ORF type:complete len:161 (+),score=17.70 gnl/MRDRNA2_/MRDRNA2_73240_c0_seq2:74-484(+)
MGSKMDRQFVEKPSSGSKTQLTLPHGDLLSDAIDAIVAVGGVDVLNIMHTEVEDVEACLEVVRSHWSGICGVYAHQSDWKPVNGEIRWSFDDAMSPDEYATVAEQWLDSGVQLIGGCCGTRPDHITALHRCCYKCK